MGENPIRCAFDGAVLDSTDERIGNLRVAKAEGVRVGSSRPKKQLKVNANDDVYALAA